MFGPVDEIDQLPVGQLDEGVEQMYPAERQLMVVAALQHRQVRLLQGLQD